MRDRRRPFVAALAVLVVAATLATTMGARADARDPVAAQALFEAGRADMARGQYADACPKLAESQRLDPAAGTLINLADCEEHIGHLAMAWEHWKEAIASLSSHDDRLPGATQRATAIEKRVPRLTLRLAPDAPPGAVVHRDEIEIRAASLDVALPLDPGEHVVTVTAPGRVDRAIKVTLAEGESRVLVITAGDATRPEPKITAPPFADAPRALAEPHSGTTRTIGFAVAGVGVLGLGAGAVTGILAVGKKSTVDDACVAGKGCSQAGFDAAHDGHTLATVSTIAFLAGAAATGVGVWLVLASGSKGTHASSGRGPGVALIALPNGGAVAGFF